MGNCLAIFILGTKRRHLSSVFNSMLTCLLVLHTFYIFTNMTLIMRRYVRSYILDFLFTHFLYPLKPMLHNASTFLTVVMAKERFKAIR